jgi:hypothetical protein
VASLLMKVIKDLGWLIPGECGGRLSIVMDNCGGQNKNKMVLRLALYLVEKKLFKCVEFIFYIRGHTKNVCDRLFNLLKINYSKANCVYNGNSVGCSQFNGGHHIYPSSGK